MTAGGGLFEDAANFDQRYVRSYRRITEITASLRDLGISIVLTSGSFDLLHYGHSMYLEAARQHGGFLVVGVDSDNKIGSRKRRAPAVPELERLQMVAHQRGVGLVTLKHVEPLRWTLISAVRPDVLVATEETYSEDDIVTLETRYVGQVVVLPRMAEVSTSARLRLLQLRREASEDHEGAAIAARARGDEAAERAALDAIIVRDRAAE